MKIQTYCKKQSDFFIKSKIFFLVVFICERSVVERKITIHIDVGESSSPTAQVKLDLLKSRDNFTWKSIILNVKLAYLDVR